MPTIHWQFHGQKAATARNAYKMPLKIVQSYYTNLIKFSAVLLIFAAAKRILKQ